MQSLVPAPSLASPAPSTSPQDLINNAERGWQMQTRLEQQQDLARNLSDQLKSQQTLTDDLKSQLAQQQSVSDNLKTQVDQQQRNTEQLIAQIQEQQRILDRMAAAQQMRPASDFREQSADNNSVQTIVLAVGGVLLVVVVVGTIVLVGTILLVALSRRRQPRTVHVVQPVPTPYNFAEPQLLPPRSTRARPTQQIDVDYYAD